MPRFSTDKLLQALQALDVAEGASLCVAFSGGLDSTVLLHGLSRIVKDGTRFQVRAIHVDHGLHADSARWRARAEATARALDVAFTHVDVRVEPANEGLEAAARNARYRALHAELQPHEVLLTAHHADDQLETMLLALVRGAGVNGLSGIPGAQPFSPGRLVRPLLAFTREALKTWGQAEGLEWIDDPSNQNTDLDRNYLRRQVLPALRERWPATSHNAVRSAAHLGDAAQLLSSLAADDAREITVGENLSAAGLIGLTPARRRNVLRHWIRERGARAPSTRKLAAIEHDLLSARADRIPSVTWDDVVVRRFRGLLSLAGRLPTFDASREISWNAVEPIELPANLGRLHLLVNATGGVDPAKLSPTLQIRFRTGGESVRPAGDAHHRSLKKMLQAAAVPPWLRDRLPLLYSDERLVAVADLWIAEEFATKGEGMRVIWEKDDERRATSD